MLADWAHGTAHVFRSFQLLSTEKMLGRFGGMLDLSNEHIALMQGLPPCFKPGIDPFPEGFPASVPRAFPAAELASALRWLWSWMKMQGMLDSKQAAWVMNRPCHENPTTRESMSNSTQNKGRKKKTKNRNKRVECKRIMSKTNSGKLFDVDEVSQRM